LLWKFISESLPKPMKNIKPGFLRYSLVKLSPVLFLGFILILLQGCHHHPMKDAKEYNEYIVSKAASLTTVTGELKDMILEKPFEVVEQARKKALDSTEAIIKALTQLEDYPEETGFRQSVIDMGKLNKMHLDNEYKQVTEIRSSLDYEADVAEYEKLANQAGEVLVKAEKMMDKAFEVAQAAQIRFCQKHNLKVSPVHEQ
jgi:hypothetical protein